MEYTARWGTKGFLISPQKIVPLSGLSTSVSAKIETQNDTSGSGQTNIIGRELQPVSFSTVYMRAAGVDPRAQLEEWEALVGQVNTLYVEGKRFGPEKLMLKSVSASGIEMTTTGKFLMVKIDLSFEEYANGATTAPKEKETGTNTGGVVYSGGDYKPLVEEKKTALNTGTNAVEKSTKKPVGMRNLK